jgi:ABC-2 type transport system permease protein
MTMRAFLAMIRANLKMTVRNRTALFWNLIFPALFILIFGAVFDQGQIEFDVGVAGESSAAYEATIQTLEAEQAFSVTVEDDTETALEALKDGDRDVVLVFGEENGAATPPVQIYYDETDQSNAQIAVGAVNNLLLRVLQGEEGTIAQPVAVTGQDITFMDFFLPGILAMAIMNSGVIGLSTAFVTYRERGILRRIKVTPFRLTSFISARVVSQLIVAVPQSLILIGLALLFFDFTLRGNPLVILLVIFLGALAFLSIGFAVSSIAPNVETAASYSNLITFPMLFLSGVFFDIDFAPEWLKPITRVLPLRYLVDALREPMTRGNGLEAIWMDLLLLLLTLVVAMAIAVRFFRWDARST